MMATSALLNRWRKLKHDLCEIWPGLNLVLGVALVSRYLHSLLSTSLFGKVISEILIAILLGLYIRALIGKNAKLVPGIAFSMKIILRIGIILLGLRLSLQDIGATGLAGLGLIAACITVVLVLATGAQRLFKISPRLAALIGVGTAICGNSAIIATAPVIEADEEDVSFAVATITLFGLLAVLVYPLLGRWLGLTDYQFGLWSGTAVNDTSQVVAVSAMFSDHAQNIATIIKLTRNVLMAPLILITGMVYQRMRSYRAENAGQTQQGFKLSKFIPGFVLGFILMALLRTAGVAVGFLPQNVAQPGALTAAAQVLISLDWVSKFAILMALSAVGLNTDLSSLKRIGMKPLLVGTIVAVFLSVTSLLLILFTPLGG